MNPRLLRALAASALLAAPLRAQAGQVSVEYLANEGVLVSHGTTRVLIDALFGNGLPEYPNVVLSVRDSLERALGRFGEVQLVLVTHRHDDHFSAAAVARHLRANPGAHLAAPAEVVVLVSRAGWADPARTSAIRPDPAQPARWTGPNVIAEAHAVPHAGIEHLVWVLELGGRRVLHAGDANPSPAQLRHVAGTGVDLLLIPWWIAPGGAGPERIGATGARQVAAFHVGHSDGTAGLPTGVRVLRHHGEGFTIERAGGR